MNTQPNANDLNQKINCYLEELAVETDLARKSEVMLQYLNFAAKFHQYSPSNIWLILFAKPEATNVAGFQTWKKMGRYVKKGEKGIPIFAPVIHKEDPGDEDSQKIINGFRVVYVFDVSQTDGNPLPPIPHWISPEQKPELKAKLVRFAESKGIHVLFKELPEGTQGVSLGGRIVISSSAGTKTIVHEIAHELLHRGKEDLTHAVREAEAEATAYTVCRYFGLTNLASSNYLLVSGADRKTLMRSLERINITAKLIVDNIISSENLEYKV